MPVSRKERPSFPQALVSLAGLRLDAIKTGIREADFSLIKRN